MLAPTGGRPRSRRRLPYYIHVSGKDRRIFLEKFVSQHGNVYVILQACGLQAAMANIAFDTGVNGKRGDFEAAAA